MVRWNGATSVEVQVSNTSAGTLCGLCGNYDTLPANDWRIGPSCSGVGSLSATSTRFGHSWKFGDDNDTDCTQNCNEPDPVCSNKMETHKLCAVLKDPKGRFKSCLAVMSRELIDSLYESCVFDVCQSSVNRTEALCQQAQIFVDFCQRDLQVPLPSWRDVHFCRKLDSVHILKERNDRFGINGFDCTLENLTGCGH